MYRLQNGVASNNKCDIFLSQIAIGKSIAGSFECCDVPGNNVRTEAQRWERILPFEIGSIYSDL
jgi:hypothetical protein